MLQGSPIQPNLFEQRLTVWLNNLGLQYNPFTHLDAGSDPNLSTYLVGHEAFIKLWQDHAAFVFAPIGGGKSAFRVRLARACRVEENGRRVFPVVYKMPSPARLQDTAFNPERHLRYLNQSISQELLLTLAYRPERYFVLPDEVKASVRRQLQLNYPGDLVTCLAQLSDRGTLAPLVESIDPSADRLFAPPDPGALRTVCADLSQGADDLAILALKKEFGSPENRFATLIDLIVSAFGFEAVYILVDSVDAHIETILKPPSILYWLGPLLTRTAEWAKRKIYIKYFLPDSLRVPELFTVESAMWVNIEWRIGNLHEVLRDRLLAASDGRFDSLDAISTPALRSVHDQLLTIAKPLPREVMALTNRLLTEHIWRMQEEGGADSENTELAPVDLERAKNWYITDSHLRATMGGKL